MENDEEKTVDEVESNVEEQQNLENENLEEVETEIETEVVEEEQSEEEKKMNGYALASFICSIIGLLIFGMPLGLAAIVTGVNGIKEFDKEKQNNKWMAIAGLIIGIIDVIFVSQYAIVIYNQAIENYRYFAK